jgi:multidrug efflux system membrane fusion protein
VVAVKARKGSIGVYFDGLGAVTPIYTTLIKSRVDGELLDVFYKEGEMVNKGDRLAEIDPRPFQVQLTQAEGQLARDQALLDNARVDLVRYETLIKQNAVAEQTLVTQKALIAQYEGQIKSDQGAIDSAKLNITYSHITAPIAGRIGLRLVDPGNIVHAADANGLLVITQVQPISVIFTIAEDQLRPVIKKYQAGARLRVDAYDRDKKTKLATGTLTTIDNQIDQTTGTLKLRATYDNSRNELFPNQFVNARLLVQEKNGVTLIPSAAVQRNERMTYAWLVKPDSSVAVREIATGTTEGADTEVTSGLQPGDVVVMTGVDKLQEGAKVNAQFEGAPGARSAAPATPGDHPVAGQPRPNDATPVPAKGGNGRRKQSQ